jgi:ribonuclease HI
MTYKISYNMAIELLKSYLEKIYKLDKHKGTSPIKLQQLYELNEELRKLVEQLKEDGHDTDLLIRRMKEELEPKYHYDKLVVNVDGAARGNNDTEVPNISGIAFIIHGDSQQLYRGAKFLGNEIALPHLRNEDLSKEPERAIATNNTAEYVALIEALEYMLENGLNAKEIEIFSDSRMVVTQVNMISTTKAPHLVRLRDCAQQLLDEFDNVTLVHVPREQNAAADELVNELLDKIEQEMDEQVV